MAGIATIAEQVRLHWRAQGLRVNAVPPQDLKHSNVADLPEDYETFLRLAGLPDDEDSAGFRFWSPKELRATGDILSAAGYTNSVVHPSVIIADHLQESWWYCLWSGGPWRGCVSLVLGTYSGRDPLPPLGNFADFLLAYLTDDACLYPPPSPR